MQLQHRLRSHDFDDFVGRVDALLRANISMSYEPNCAWTEVKEAHTDLSRSLDYGCGIGRRGFQIEYDDIGLNGFRIETDQR